MNPALKNATAIVGVGFTPMLRAKAERSLERRGGSALGAIRDAGLQPSDIDGYAGAPVGQSGGAAHWDGTDEISGRNVTATLGMKNLRWLIDINRGVIADSIVEAVNAVHCGTCNYALIVRAMYNPVGVSYAGRDSRRAGGPEQFNAPYGLQQIGRMALWLNRYMHETGATKNELYQVAKTLRDHAQLNPYAYWRGKDLTEDDYLSARPIFEPMSLTIATFRSRRRRNPDHDCDRARHLPHKPAYLSAYASTWDRATRSSRSGIARDEVQAAQLYEVLAVHLALARVAGVLREG